MLERTAVIFVALTLLTAGCLGGPSTADPEETPRDERSLSGDAVPGVSNGTLTNASALAQANQALLAESGGEVETTYAEGDRETSMQLRIGAGFSTYTLTGAFPGTGADVAQMAIWSNETTRFIRTESASETRYRVVAREDEVPNTIALAERYLASGEFSVTNESRGDGTVVLTADTYTPAENGNGPFGSARSYNGTLVVTDSGLIQNLTVSAVRDGQPVRYRFQVIATGVDRVSPPDWFDEIPENARLDPDVEVTVENESYLALRHQGGDAVPAESVFTLTSNHTTRNASLSTPLGADAVKFAYIDAADGTLHLTDQRPDESAVQPVSSPVSVSLETGDGVVIFSGGMGWESGSASAGGSSGEGSSGSSGGSSSESSR